MNRIASGDQLAMRALFARHHVAVYRFAIRIGGDETAADDIVSQVFFDVWRLAATFEGRSTVSTWLLSITRHKALSALRQRRRHSDVGLDNEAVCNIIDPVDDPEVALQKNHLNSDLRQCLTHLSPIHREVIDLVYYHEKSVKEVATIVNATEATVKTRMFYARKKLAKSLKAA